MKKSRVIRFSLLALSVFAIGFAACAKSEGATEGKESGNGSIVDKVIFTVSMDESLAVKDVVEGRSDVFFQAVPPSIMSALSDTDRDKLDVYRVPSGAWSLITNPIPNKAPYTVKIPSGETVFNPLAVREVRYALNWLIDRKKIVDEILLGEGMPQMTSMTVGQPGTYQYNLIPAKLGMTETGDETKAIADIDAAMQAAAALPQNKGKLVKGPKFWQYNGKDVTVKFVIRVDDPNGRLLEGRYIAAQLEKAGFAVEQLEWDRVKANGTVYQGNPADYAWTLYTEGWGAGATRRWWDISLSQMYAPYYGYMPGGAEEGNWNYTHKKLDELGKKGLNGQFLTTEEYWRDNLEAQKIGLEEAVRIYVCSNLDSFVANKARFNKRMLYGLGDGLNNWSINSADVKPDTDGAFKGQKVLRVVSYSSRGGLFMSPWDPVGKGGFADVFSTMVANPCSDTKTDEAPNSAIDIPLLSTYDVDSAKVAPKLLPDGSMGGDVEVPADAVLYDTKTKEWKKVGSGFTVSVAASGKLYDGYRWHTGLPVTNIDARYAHAFSREWAIKDGDDDKYYDSALSESTLDALKNIKGVVFSDDGSIVSYVNYFFAPDMNRTVSNVGAVGVQAGAPGRRIVCPWEIYEALAEMVVHGSASGTAYSFAKDTGTEVDILTPAHVADIKAKLAEFVEQKHIPVSLKGLITEEEALERYKASIAFIEKYGHAYISNGPIMLTKIDTTTNSVIADAFRDYPYDSRYWPAQFSQKATAIEHVKLPSAPSADKDAEFEINVSEFVYPEIDYKPLSGGTVEIHLQQTDGTENVYLASKKSDGKFVAAIPAADMAKLQKGIDYTVVVISFIEKDKDAPSVTSVKLNLL
ncbi:ABC transporter substrate-binding protein [Treponema phagedenis]|uniref:ABC transporter substrate-binding protein n=1 Tax=Treponema phagedenis TaxID=162 RepID=A0AAE6ITD4_TREPH|nr:ABC transporter substrate-binding protein [Treponema phagedenis]QEJ97526.1 ABC transporter substrate-binding protein [Treponema phagedenis]QEK01660.1 ABC transporter substrate-binding protein [Treponema phagedenis]